MNIERKKICFVSGYHGFYPAGGAEYQSYVISNELQKRFEIFFISPYKEDKILKENDKTIFGYKRRFGKKIFGSNYIFNYNIFSNYLRMINPHIIYQRGLSSLTAFCSYYAKKNKIPFVFSVSSDKDLSRMNAIETIRYPLHKIDHIFGKWGIQNASKIIVQSFSQRDYLKKHYHRDGILIRNVYNRNDEVNNDGRYKKNQIVCVCKYNRNKSPDICMKIAGFLPHRRFIIAGIEKDTREFNRFNNIDSVPENIEFIGVLEKKKFLKLLSESKVFLSTSLYEGFPNTFVEAWINRTAVVSLNVNPDNLLDGKCGYCVKGDIKLAAEKIEELLSDIKQFESLVESSYTFAKGAFDLKENVDTLERTINQQLR